MSGISPFRALIAHRNVVRRNLTFATSTPEANARNEAILERLEREIAEVTPREEDNDGRR